MSLFAYFAMAIGFAASAFIIAFVAAYLKFARQDRGKR